MKRGLGQIESRFFAFTQMRGLTTVRAGKLEKPLGLTAPQERKLLSRLAKAGMIARVWRGLYLVPPRLPLGGSWSPDEELVLNTLMEDRRGRYQICGPNAFNRYGFDNQMPARVYVYNNQVSGERTIGAVTLTLIKVADNRLGDVEKVRTSTGLMIAYSSRVRTLVDAVYDWARFNSLPRGYKWICCELTSERVSPTALVNVTLRYGNIGVIRRMGALLEQEGVDAALLRKLERSLRPTTSVIPWIPTLPKRGTVNRRWGVVLNEQT